MNKLLEQVLIANIYLQPVQFFIIIAVNILNIRVLCSRALRSSPCTHYFLAYAIFSIIYTALVCSTQFLRGLNIDWANGKFGCKLHAYILFMFPLQGNVMLILASFDRYCSSSQSRPLHSKSTIRTARTVMVISTFLCAIYMSPMLIIYNWNENSKCLQQSNTLIHIYILSQVIFYYILAPMLMIVFGSLTICNIHHQAINSKLLTASIRRRRTEGQLARMLILQVIIHLILVLPFGIIYAMNSLDPSTRTRNVLAIRYIFVIWQQCDYFVSFFLYVLSGNIYRQELFRILKSLKCHNTSTQAFVRKKKGINQELHLIMTTVQNANGIVDDAPV
jgi:heme/copper-type cytochrome/quinol oxidase subunit 2